MTQTAMPGTAQRAILFMLAAICAFSVMDVAVKALAPRVGVLPAMWARYTGQMIVVTLLILPRARQVIRTQYLGTQVLRSALLMGATALFFSGLNLIPLAEAAALMSLNPVLITLGAALFLGEALGPRRIAGIAVAMIGALMIIRPGSAVFSPAAFFPLAGAMCFSGYALLTRRLGADEDVWTSLFYTGVVGTCVLTLVIPFAWVPPDAGSIALMLTIATAGTTGQLFMIRAFTTGDAAMLAPYAYLSLVFAMIWGMSLFGEWPDLWTIAGAMVISGAGVYVWYREIHQS